MSTVMNVPRTGGEQRNLIIVFGTMQSTGDLDNSNFNSIMGTKLIGVDGNQGKREVQNRARGIF